ncbi:PRTRC system protein B [Deinococcus sp. SL84]|uniref:PRTRC system protein B n=1 Tax=Deinococcus sp. SL84 TaxID=2994663 RepID=UPI002272FF7B|nr:PRTRC system protein B [Deinococcus sp. SL84]MCY1704010.1 PRTRC system protein B [Deinococcus sp. SL84]
MKIPVSNVLLKATDALVLFSSPHSTLVQHYPLTESGGQLIFGAGAAVTDTFFAELAQRAHSSLMFLPGEVLGFSTHEMIWWEPAKKRGLFFHESSSVQIQEPIPLPALLFQVTATGAMSVYALNGDARPDLDTQLYHAPLMNVFGNQQVCLGSTELPDHLDPRRTAEYSEAYFRSAFTHGRPQLLTEQPYAAVLHEAARQGTFPTTLLKPTGKTLAELFGS